MPSDFVQRARVAYATLPVPPIPLAGIRARTHRRDRRQRATIAAAGAAVVVASFGLASGAGAAIKDAIRVWISGGTAAVDVRGMTLTKHPMRADLAGVVARATFPIVFPVGLPKGMRLWRVIVAPSDHPTTISVEYMSGRVSSIGFTLIDASTIHAGNAPAGLPNQPVQRWIAGREVVIVPAARAGQTAPIERAMQSATPATSLAANDLLTARIISLDAPLDVQAAAERIATDERSVLLDSRHLSLVPSLARAGRPLLDDRTVTLTNIPHVDGSPDYQHATLRFSRGTAVSGTGVREIATYLRRHRALPHGALLFRPDVRGDARIVAIPSAPKDYRSERGMK